MLIAKQAPFALRFFHGPAVRQAELAKNEDRAAGLRFSAKVFNPRMLQD
jgi:hypothetical protein